MPEQELDLIRMFGGLVQVGRPSVAPCCSGNHTATEMWDKLQRFTQLAVRKKWDTAYLPFHINIIY